MKCSIHLFVLSLLISIMTLVPNAAFAQNDSVDYAPAKQKQSKPPKQPFKDRIWFGGGINLTFGTVTSIGVSPMVGYKIDRKGKWSAGVGLSYNYFKDTYYTPAYETDYYGYQIFTRYRVIPQVYLHTEFDQYNYELYIPGVDDPGRYWVPYWLVGGGVSQPVGGNAYLTFQILWDVLQDPKSPNGSAPWITAGVGVGF